MKRKKQLHFEGNSSVIIEESRHFIAKKKPHKVKN